jgi:DNA-3-methyladenine glycosylase
MINPRTKILLGPAHSVAPRLLGSWLVRDIEGQTLVARIVETEAYDESDMASHSYRGQTASNSVMFGPPGRLYVYFTYGKHYCCNVVTGPSGSGAAVLIRAVEPLEGQSVMHSLRQAVEPRNLTNGPAKVCQAMGIDKRLNGHDLRLKPLQLLIKRPIAQSSIIQTTRIGISRDTMRAWRYYLKHNSYVSKP